eukprot:16544-Eustigmatos_ZCMA.PRE.1
MHSELQVSPTACCYILRMPHHAQALQSGQAAGAEFSAYPSLACCFLSVMACMCVDTPLRPMPLLGWTADILVILFRPVSTPLSNSHAAGF